MAREYSGKLMVRMPPELHRRLSNYAQRQQVSLNVACVNAIENKIRPAVSVSVGSLEWSEGLVRLLKKLELPVVALYLFGSAARGEAHAASDIDLLVVLEKDSAVVRELYSIWDQKIAAILPREVNPHFVAIPRDIQDTGSLWFEVALEGIALWESGGETRKVLTELRRWMAEGKIQRAVRHGHPYWIRPKKEKAND